MGFLGIRFPSFTDAQVDALEKRAQSSGWRTIWFPADVEPDRALLTQCEVLMGTFSTRALRDAASLQWYQTSMAGVEKILQHDAHMERAFLLTNCAGAYGASIAEHLLAGALMLIHRMPLYQQNQKARIWRAAGPCGSFCGSVVTVLGLGDVGGTFAARAKALGAFVRGVKRTDAKKPPCVDALYTMEQLDAALQDADIIAACLPATAETENLFNRERLFSLKPGALFLNVGRGSVVDEVALAETLAEGRLGGAYLDVARVEPLPQDSPLWQLDNLIITPHVAGRSYDALNRDLVFHIFCRNLDHYLSGRPLTHIVDRARGY